jgi:GTP-binding protein Era
MQKSFAISALETFGVPEVSLVALLNSYQNPTTYPKDQLTDKPERFFCNEIIREKTNALHAQRNTVCCGEIDTEESLKKNC